MGTILLHHLRDVIQALLSPTAFGRNMLPSWNFGDDQNTSAVAFIDKCLALGIMAGAHRVDAELFIQNSYIFFLKGIACGISEIGETLMPV